MTDDERVPGDEAEAWSTDDPAAPAMSDDPPAPDDPARDGPSGPAGPGADGSPAAPARRRPFGVMVLAGLLIIKAVLLATVVLGSFVELPTLREALRLPRLVPGLRESPIAVAIILLLAGLLVLSASGLLARKRSGWLLAMVLTGGFIALDIAAYLEGSANHTWMLLNIVTVLYLNQAEVRAEFTIEDAFELDVPEAEGVA